MIRSLMLSEDVYERLENAARRQGLASVEQWIILRLPPTDDELARRRAQYERIVAFQQKIGAKYGVQPDSAPLIREDRER